MLVIGGIFCSSLLFAYEKWLFKIVMNRFLSGLLLKNSNMSSFKNDVKPQPRRTSVIREVYEGVNSQARFEYELECALEAKADYIVIEPTKLGMEAYKFS